MPGSVGGDLIKAWYVAGREPERKGRAVFLVLLDRIIGLAVILFYAAFTMIFFSSWLNSHHELKIIGLILWGFTAGAFIFGVLFFFPQLWKIPIVSRFLNFLRRKPMIAGVMDTTLLYQNHLNVV